VPDGAAFRTAPRTPRFAAACEPSNCCGPPGGLTTRRVNLLGPRGQRTVRLTADGYSDAEIAYEMVLDLDTVTRLRRESQDFLGATSRAELRHAFAGEPVTET